MMAHKAAAATAPVTASRSGPSRTPAPEAAVARRCRRAVGTGCPAGAARPAPELRARSRLGPGRQQRRGQRPRIIVHHRRPGCSHHPERSNRHTQQGRTGPFNKRSCYKLNRGPHDRCRHVRQGPRSEQTASCWWLSARWRAKAVSLARRRGIVVFERRIGPAVGAVGTRHARGRTWQCRRVPTFRCRRLDFVSN